MLLSESAERLMHIDMHGKHSWLRPSHAMQDSHVPTVMKCTWCAPIKAQLMYLGDEPVQMRRSVLITSSIHNSIRLTIMSVRTLRLCTVTYLTRYIDHGCELHGVSTCPLSDPEPHFQAPTTLPKNQIARKTV